MNKTVENLLSKIGRKSKLIAFVTASLWNKRKALLDILGLYERSRQTAWECGKGIMVERSYDDLITVLAV